MKNKSKWRFLWVPTIALLILTALFEIVQLDFIVEEMTANGMQHMIVALGIIKLGCTIVFLVPKTRHIGFLLCTAYIGGIIAAEWITEEPPIAGALLQSLLWVGMYFEAPKLFQFETAKKMGNE